MKTKASPATCLGHRKSLLLLDFKELQYLLPTPQSAPLFNTFMEP